LDGPDGPVVEQKAMMEVAVNLYKDLFKKENRHEIHLDAEFLKESEKVTNEENNALTTPFTELEMKEAVLGCLAKRCS
jgi:hypothetical protein